MSRRPGLLTVLVLLLAADVALPVDAHAFELSGAWASHADLCNLVFSKQGGQVAFTELSDLYGSGFIVEGNRMKGKAGQCTIESRKQDGDNLELSAACASSIMTQTIRFKLKILDDNNLTRYFPEIEGMTLTYSRCKF